MYTIAHVVKYKETEEGTDLIIHVPNHLAEMIQEKHMRTIECRFDDGRTITSEQRRKCYAMFKDISYWMGDVPESVKEYMKTEHIIRTGCDSFSLRNCSIDLAREFINTMIEFCLQNGIALSEIGIDRTDDIGKYLWYCLKYKKCAVCGKAGEIHHEDAIGMGNDRTKYDDSNNKKICLCRTHHTIAHQKGIKLFQETYKVYGIIFKGE